MRSYGNSTFIMLETLENNMLTQWLINCYSKSSNCCVCVHRSANGKV